MKEDNIEALQWFVDFANLDLEGIKAGDRAKLLVEAEEYLWPREELKEYQSSCPPGSSLPKSLLKGLAWALEIPPKESAEYWTAILQSQKVVREIFVGSVGPTVVVGSRLRQSAASGKPVPSIIIRGYDDMLWWVGKGYKFPYTMKLLPVAKSQDDYLPLKIFMLLDGLPQHAIRLCPGCKKFFLNPTNRKKRFCGNQRCMWRVSTAERRGANREEYNDSQAERMRKRYIKEKGLEGKKIKPPKGKEPTRTAGDEREEG